jgi:hypothetical protein
LYEQEEIAEVAQNAIQLATTVAAHCQGHPEQTTNSRRSSHLCLRHVAQEREAGRSWRKTDWQPYAAEYNHRDEVHGDADLEILAPLKVLQNGLNSAAMRASASEAIVQSMLSQVESVLSKHSKSYSSNSSLATDGLKRLLASADAARQTASENTIKQLVTFSKSVVTCIL